MRSPKCPAALCCRKPCVSPTIHVFLIFSSPSFHVLSQNGRSCSFFFLRRFVFFVLKGKPPKVAFHSSIVLLSFPLLLTPTPLPLRLAIARPAFFFASPIIQHFMSLASIHLHPPSVHPNSCCVIAPQSSFYTAGPRVLPPARIPPSPENKPSSFLTYQSSK